MKRLRLFNGFCMAAVLSTGALFAAGCGGDDRAADTSGSPAGTTAGAVVSSGDASATRGPEINVTGCLTANIDGLSYALTPSDTATTASERSMQMPGRQTITYELVGNAEDFRRHANSVVTARGREDVSVRREGDMERTDEAEQRPAPGTSATPTVETTEEVEINVRRLTVSSVVATGAICPSMGAANPSTGPQTPR